MMLKSKSTADIRTQTDSSYRQYGTLCTSITEQKRELQNHLTFLQRKQETRALRATFHNFIDGSIKVNTPNSGLFLKKSNFTKKNDTQKSGNSQKMIPKNQGATSKKVPKIMAHPRITTYASPPPPEDIVPFCSGFCSRVNRKTGPV